MSARREAAFPNSGPGDSAVEKPQRRLSGAAPQNEPPPTGFPQRRGHLQPAVILVTFGTVSMQKTAQGTG